MDIPESKNKESQGERIIKEIIQENFRTWVSRLKEPQQVDIKNGKDTKGNHCKISMHQE